MIHEAKLVVDEGYIFVEEGSGFERLNVAYTRDTLAFSNLRVIQTSQGGFF